MLYDLLPLPSRRFEPLPVLSSDLHVELSQILLIVQYGLLKALLAVKPAHYRDWVLIILFFLIYYVYNAYSVQEPATFPATTVTRDLLFLERELVVVEQLLPWTYLFGCVYDNALPLVNGNDSRNTIRLTAARRKGRRRRLAGETKKDGGKDIEGGLTSG